MLVVQMHHVWLANGAAIEVASSVILGKTMTLPF